MEHSTSVEGQGEQGGKDAGKLRLFVVHAGEDAWFVDGFLLPALGLPEGEVLVSSKLEPGAAIAKEIERGALSAVTVAVVTPAFLSSPWAQLASQLATVATVEAAGDGSASLIPALLADCDLPLLARFRVPLDFRIRDPQHWETQAARLRKRLAAPAPAVAKLDCPYPGLRAFTSDNAAQFYGREHEIADLLARLRDRRREIYVIGPSGSGKSSLVAAGLIPRMASKPELAGGSFEVRRMRPGADPGGQLAAALDATVAERAHPAAEWVATAIGRLVGATADQRVLIFVDQLEEMFTLADASARGAFLGALRALRGDARVALVLTLRADFYASLMESELWTDLEGQLPRLDVGPLRGPELRTAIEAPARSLGVSIEPVLIERLLRDVSDEPGALPLLQDVLLELWNHRTRGAIRLTEYEAMSDGGRTGLAVTIARRADDAIGELPAARRDIARRVLLRLVQFDGAQATRRQQLRSALATAGDSPDEIDAVIRHLADRRLITTSGGEGADRSARVDLAHEVLLTAWPALGEWIRTRRQDEQRRRALEARAAEWLGHGAGASRLLDADEVRDARGWLGGDRARDLGISEDLQRLIVRSEAAAAAAAAEVEARRRRWRNWGIAVLVATIGGTIAVSTLAVIAVARSRDARELARVAEDRSQEARRQAQVAKEQTQEAVRQAALADEQSRRARQLLARDYAAQGHALMMAGQLAQAVPYLVAARESGMETAALRALFRWAEISVPVMRVEHHRSIRALAWSPDGARLATASDDRTAQIWDAATGKPIGPPLAHQGNVLAIAWSPDGARVATASNDGTARVWSAATGRAITPPLDHDRTVVAVAWSPDGQRVATASWDVHARIWDAATGQIAGPVMAHTWSVLDVAWSPDGTRLATASGDKTARVWDAATGKPIAGPLGHGDSVVRVAWSPDSKRVATASTDNTARVWDAATGKPVTPPLVHKWSVKAIAWSPDGKRIATAAGDKTARIWDAATGAPISVLAHGDDDVTSVAWSPDGARLVTASGDLAARVWDAATGAPLTPPLAQPDRATAAAWSPDGQHLATASYDGTALIWNIPPRQVGAPLVHPDEVAAAVWSPDGRYLATASLAATRVWDAIGHSITPPLSPLATLRRVHGLAWSPKGNRLATIGIEGTAQVWDAVTGELVAPPLQHGRHLNALVWSPDGKRIATAGGDHTAGVWDATTAELVAPAIAHQSDVLAIAWRPDGARIATGSVDRTARVWDAATGAAVTPPLAHAAPVSAVAWSPDGKSLATASFNGAARVWDAASGRAVTRELWHRGGVNAVAWSSDGRRLATASEDATIRVWDPASGQLVAPPFAHKKAVRSIQWSPDGGLIVSASDDGTARVWDAVSGQELTPPLAHARGLNTAAWRPDGARIATASDDGTVRIWDVAGDRGDLAAWRAVVSRGGFRLNSDGVLVAREQETAEPEPAPVSPPAAPPPSTP